MKSKILLLSFGIILGMNSCEKVAPSAPSANIYPHLVNCWTHHQEISQAEGHVYELCDSRDWPISRYRNVMEFYEDGTCKYFVLDPTDGHYFETGTYSVDEADNVTIKLSNQNVGFKILKLAEDRLEVSFQ